VYFYTCLSLILTDALCSVRCHNLSADFLLWFYAPFYITLSVVSHLSYFTGLYGCAHFAVVLISSVLHILYAFFHYFMNNMDTPLSSIVIIIIFIVFRQARVRTTHAVTGLAKGLYFLRARWVIYKVNKAWWWWWWVYTHCPVLQSVRPFVCLSMTCCQRLKHFRILMKSGVRVTDKFCHANVSFVKIGLIDCTEGLK